MTGGNIRPKFSSILTPVIFLQDIEINWGQSGGNVIYNSVSFNFRY